MTKEETLALLDKSGIKYERFDHRAIFTVEEGEGIDFPHPEAGTKNLFVHDDKKQHFYLITVCEHKRVDLKAFAAENGLRKLSFGSEEELWRYLALRPGSVSPLGLLSGSAGDVRFFLDSDLRGSLIGAHPCDNTATVYMTDSDLFSLLRGADVEYGYADIPERN